MKNIEAVINMFIDKQQIPGALTMVVQRGEILHKAVQGYRDIETQSPLQMDSIFRIYSMTKPITAVAVMMLYEQELFALDDAIAKYLPAFTSMQVHTDDGFVPADSPITIRQLLTHNSGLTYSMMADHPEVARRYAADALNEVHSRQRWSLETHTNKLAEQPLIAQPGAVFRYSESIGVLARLVEVLTGQHYRDFLMERVFKPLAMNDTDYYLPPEKSHRLAKLYERHSSGIGFDLTEDYGGDYRQPTVLEAGGAGLLSTASDYLQFAQMLLNQGEFNGQRLLSSHSVQQIMSDQYKGTYPEKVPDTAKDESKGLGFGMAGYVVIDSSQRSGLGNTGEYGWGGWASTNFWVDPLDQVVGIVMTQIIPAPDEILGLGEAFHLTFYQAFKSEV